MQEDYEPSGSIIIRERERDSEEYLSVAQKNIDNAAMKIQDRMNAPMRM